MVNINLYKKNLEQPWGRIQYEIIFAQLAHIKGKKILDFGSGFGLTSKFLSKENEVLSIEPNEDMLELDKPSNYKKLLGSLEELLSIRDSSYDIILCHNVMEYVEPEERQAYFEHFKRILKPEGKLSIIKHNHVGKILQTVVLENDISKALQLLDGEEFDSVSFAKGNTYSIEELIEVSGMKLEKYQAIRTFYSLQTNELKTADTWLEEMTKIEMAVCDMKPYKDISFLQHVWLRKK
ncbi:methyltransferase domain-containing protein [Streptococcus parauberis]|uniref:Methyltransferase domain-containing protein n=1 Tax=Streptococcus parauberis TaxID=1348 RepID=A0AAE4L264_9STRE|nr:methyltransferase domain-containing protein [Streptococcus parauberis]MDT2732750.1 methyltransferase domain-containing protein [Streptococcus parauberis]MDT2750323.1 methyltransferase domain-containing protein [Streptococcus parauberis]